MKSPSLSERLRYGFDRRVAQTPSTLVLWLLGVSLFFPLAFGLIIFLARFAPVTEGHRPVLGSQLWTSMLHFLDNGNISSDPLETGWGYVGFMLLSTLFGIVFASVITGIVTNALTARLDAMRKGRSKVIETGHTLILGWNSQVIALLHELALAGASERRNCIVILAPLDKVEMEDALRGKLPRGVRLNVVCRSGNPMDLHDLELVSPHAAKSIIVLPSRDDENPDSQTIKTVLALTNNPHRRLEPYHIVAEIQDAHHLEVAELVGQGEAQFVLSSEIISRIMVQTCRQSGLSVVYTELLDFQGSEIYFHLEASLEGLSFGEVLSRFETSCVIGLLSADNVLLCPPMQTRLSSRDVLIVIAEDDHTTRLSSHTSPFDDNLILSARAGVHPPEHTLLLGWNARGSQVVRELDFYVNTGSTLTLLAPLEDLEARVLQECPDLKNLLLRVLQGDPSDPRLLASLLTPSQGLEGTDHIIVLSPSDALEAQQADAQTLVTLLHLRELTRTLQNRPTVISEMLDDRNRELAEVTQADDFIVSDKLVSLMLSQMSENRQLREVFRQLFSAQGAEIDLRPVGDYVTLERELDFYTLLESAQRRGEIALGYRLEKESRHVGAAYGVRVNPPKNRR